MFQSGEMFKSGSCSTAGVLESIKKLGAGAIAGIVIAVILLVLIVIDFFCCFFNSCGLIFCCHQALCGGGGKGEGAGAGGKDDYMDGKATEMEKKPLPTTEEV